MKSEKFWDLQAKNFDKQVEKHFKQDYIQSIEKTKKYLKPTDIVLDFACGTGLFALQMAECVQHILALDISLKMIQIAGQKAKKENVVNIHFSKSTLPDAGLTPESFDVILAYNILHLVQDPKATLLRLYDLIKPDGVLITSTVCMAETKSLIRFIVFCLVKTRIVPYMSFFKISQLEEMIVREKLQIIETETYLDFSTPNYFVVAKKVK